MRVREWIIVLAVGLSGGCEWDMQGLTPATKPALVPAAAPTTRPVAKAPPPAAEPAKPPESYLAKNGLNKEGDAAGGKTAVESALSWANKYAQSMQTVTDLQRESRDQLKETQTLQQQNVKLQDELVAAQKADSKLPADQVEGQHKRLAESQKKVEAMTRNLKKIIDAQGRQQQ